MGRGYYILGMAQQHFYTVGIREPRIPTDHWMVLLELIGDGARRHRWYGMELTTWPITEANGGTIQEGDYHFMALNQRVKKPSRKGRTTTAPWISDTTWRLADQRAALGRKLISKQGEFRTMTQRFQ